MHEGSPKPCSRFARSLLLAGALAACSATAREPELKGARIGGPFALTAQDGRTVRDTDFAGKYRIVYFGYTHCPDVCPNDLAAIGQAMRRLEKEDASRAARIQPIFISVDPERDTPPVMKEYAAAFYPRLLALTGTPEQVAAVAKEYAVWSAKQPVQPAGGYAVDHSRITILMGPRGEPIAFLPSDKGADAVATALRKWVT
jgi:protein SCO1/2